MEGTEKRIPKSASAPSAHLFDSSQLVSARKKLKKTAEGLQRRRGKLKRDFHVRLLNKVKHNQRIFYFIGPYKA